MSIRVTCLLKRRPDLTQEEFSEHWSKKHGEIFSNLKAVRENIVRYNQFHVLSEPSDQLTALGFPVAPYHGAAEFWVDKLEDLLYVFADKDYQENAVPDEANFLKKDDFVIIVGEDKTQWRK